MKIILVFILICCSSARSQSLKQINDSISAQYERIFAISQNYADESRYEDLQACNSRLINYLLKTVKDYPRTLDFKFTLPTGIWSATAPDGKLRIWSWDSWTGGSMAHCYSIAQFRSGSRVVTQVLDTSSMGGNFCWDVHSVTGKNGQMIYLPVMRGKYSGKDAAQSIKGYTISRDKLAQKSNLFVGKHKAFDEVEIHYNYFTNMIDNEQRIHVSKNKLMIPLVEGDSVTKRWLKYSFDGKVFKYKGVTD